MGGVLGVLTAGVLASRLAGCAMAVPVIDLVYYHEKSVDDCALILGIPAATVKTRMFYARKKLAELVQPEAH